MFLYYILLFLIANNNLSKNNSISFDLLNILIKNNLIVNIIKIKNIKFPKKVKIIQRLKLIFESVNLFHLGTY